MVSRFLKLSLFFMMTFLAADAATAGPNLSWDPSTGDVTGYKLYYGENSGAYDQQMDVGNQLECALSDLSTKDGTKYYFAVKAYNDAGESDFSNEVSWESGDSTPPITPQGFSVDTEPGQAILQWQLNTEDDLNGYNAYCGDASRRYGPPIPVGKHTSYTMENLEAGQQYYVAVTALDTAGNESGYSVEKQVTIQSTSAPITEPPPILSPDAVFSKIIDNSDSGFQISQNWKSSTSVGGFYGTDYQCTAAGTGGLSATWSCDIPQQGQYQIAARWTSHGNRAQDAPYEIHNNGNLLKYITVNQQKDGGKFNVLGIFQLDPGEINITLSNKASGYVIADAFQIVSTGDKAEDSISDIINPTLTIESPTDRGYYKTLLSHLDITGLASDDNAVKEVTWVNSQGESGTASGTSNWTISNFPLKPGDNLITVSAVDGAGNIAQKDITITSVPPAVSFPIIIDNSEPSFSTQGEWDNSAMVSGYYGENYSYSPKGTGSSSASWKMNVTNEGQYQIKARWTAHGNRAQDAPFSIYNNGKFIEMVKVNQQAEGGKFKFLNTYFFNAGSVTIELTDKASGYVIADAVMIDKITPPQIIDNSDVAFEIGGNWEDSSLISGFYGEGYQYSAKGNGTESASWRFDISKEGEYQIFALWTAHANRANDAPYSIYNNGKLIDSKIVNQQTSGGRFNLLNTYSLKSGELKVELTNNASGYVIADAVKVQLASSD